MLQLNPKWAAGVVGIIALIGYWWWLTSSLDSYRTLLDSYRTLSQTQAVQITTLKTSLERTQSQLMIEREATRQQTALEQAERAKLNDDEKEIKAALSAHDCAATALPDAVIKRLQQ